MFNPNGLNCKKNKCRFQRRLFFFCADYFLHGLDACRINYVMEQETIIYFYPVSEQQKMAGHALAAKRFWFQDVSLRAYRLGAYQDEFSVAGCAIPPFYFRNKSWKPRDLSEAMEEVCRRADGLTDTFLHPRIAAMLTEEYAGRWIPRRQTEQMIIKRLMEQYGGRAVERYKEAVVLLSEPRDTEWQMEMTGELLQPYLSKINKLLIFYEEIAETDIWMELGSHLDDYYYEYGLVPQPKPYAESADGFRCGKHKCNGMILDYCTGFRYPKLLPGSRAVYIDMASETDKERLLYRKAPQISYVSPLKYLDTMVKNSYDGLVN